MKSRPAGSPNRFDVAETPVLGRVINWWQIARQGEEGTIATEEKHYLANNLHCPITTWVFFAVNYWD